MNVLVTGAGGFIGGHLCKKLEERGDTVFAVDKKPIDAWHQVHGHATYVDDLSQMPAAMTRSVGMDRIFNLAADMGGMGFIEANKAKCMLSVIPSTNMLVAAHTVGVDRFFFSSSACVYTADFQTSPNVLPLREEDAYPAMPEDGYGWEKLFTERMCRHFKEDYHLETRVARYHNVYGPFGTFEGGREKAPAAICRKVAEAKLSGQRHIVIWGDGEQTRSFMHIDDCIRGTLAIMDGAWSDPVNLGSSELVSINQLVSIVEEIAGVQLERIYELNAPRGVRGRNSCNKLFIERYGWEPSTPLRTGMEELYRWIYDQLAKR